jgi:rod shape-determining protein MreC
LRQISERKGYILFILLLLVSLLIFTVYFREGETGFLRSVQKLAFAFTSTVQIQVKRVVFPLQKGWRFLSSLGRLARENEVLKRKITRLELEVKRLESLKEENQRLKRLLGFKKEYPLKTVPAKMIGASASNWQSAILISRGSKSGIERGMSVVTSGGLVGQVIEVTQDAAKVLLITDPKSGVAIKIKRTGEEGVLKARINGELYLKYIEKSARVRPGDKVYTSGLGGVFPRGILVGTVREVQQPRLSLYKKVEVKPAVNFSRLEEVLVILEKSSAGELR